MLRLIFPPFVLSARYCVAKYWVDLGGPTTYITSLYNTMNGSFTKHHLCMCLVTTVNSRKIRTKKYNENDNTPKEYTEKYIYTMTWRDWKS